MNNDKGIETETTRDNDNSINLENECDFAKKTYEILIILNDNNVLEYNKEEKKITKKFNLGNETLNRQIESFAELKFRDIEDLFVNLREKIKVVMESNMMFLARRLLLPEFKKHLTDSIKLDINDSKYNQKFYNKLYGILNQFADEQIKKNDLIIKNRWILIKKELKKISNINGGKNRKLTNNKDKQIEKKKEKYKSSSRKSHKSKLSPKISPSYPKPKSLSPPKKPSPKKSHPKKPSPKKSPPKKPSPKK